MLSAIQSCSLSTQSCSRLVIARIAPSTTLSIEQRYFATHRPYFKKAEEEQVGSTRERFTRKFREQEDYNTVPLRGKAYDNLGYPGRKGGSEQRGYGGNYERGSQDRRPKDFASLWNSNLDKDIPNDTPVDPNFTPVRFNHEASTTPAGNVQEFLTAQGIKFHQPLPTNFAPIQTFEETPFHGMCLLSDRSFLHHHHYQSHISFHYIPAGVKSLFQKKGFVTPTPVQSIGWPLVFQNKDVIGVAETGSGKTLTFMLPLAEHVKIQPKMGRSAIPRPKGLILAPTRELAQQILLDSRPYLDVYGISGTAVYGGSAKFTQLQNLRSNNDFVVGTPGRLMDMILSRELSLERISFAVFDEADRM
jgi:hypothetical protein